MKLNETLLTCTFLIFFGKLYGDDYTISGYVTDTKSEQSLIGANIYIEGTSLGSATDEKGYYKITSVKEGTYTIKVS